jgi:hypothetical protein
VVAVLEQSERDKETNERLTFGGVEFFDSI